MTVPIATLRILAREHPGAVFMAMMQGVEVCVAACEFHPDTTTVAGNGIDHYREALTIPPIGDTTGGPMLPEDLTVYHGDHAVSPVLVVKYANGCRMVAIPADGFGVVEQPRDGWHHYEVVGLPICA